MELQLLYKCTAIHITDLILLDGHDLQQSGPKHQLEDDNQAVLLTHSQGGYTSTLFS